MVVCGIVSCGIKLSVWWLCLCFCWLYMVVCGMVLGGIKLSDTQPFHTQPLHTHYLINYTTAFKNSVIFFLQEIIFTKEAKSFPAGTKKEHVPAGNHFASFVCVFCGCVWLCVGMFWVELNCLVGGCVFVFFLVVYGCLWRNAGWN